MTVSLKVREKLELCWTEKATQGITSYNAVDADVEIAKLLAEIYDLPLDEVNEFVQEKKREAQKS